MNLSNLLNQLTNSVSGDKKERIESATDSVRSLADKIPGGFTGGALAGGLIALLAGSKTARNVAGTAATYGGAAILGGLAYQAFKNWQNKSEQEATTKSQQEISPDSLQNFESEALAHSKGESSSQGFNLVLVKAMIAAARADGNIDAEERSRISEAIDNMNFDVEEKSELLELFIKPIAIEDFVDDFHSMEEKAEVYLVSCLTIDLDHTAEYSHLSNLSAALALPAGLESELRAQAKKVKSGEIES